MQHAVVVGASLAGLRACESLRTEGFAGRITLIGAEPHLPYDRPPLSKKVLTGEWEPDRIQLRKPDSFDALALDLRLGVRATALDTSARVVQTDGGDVAYDGLVIATGATPRTLPGARLEGVFVLRTLDDSLALRARLVAGTRVVVIGAGFIGLEVAASARSKDCAVTVLEGAPAPLIRGLGAAMGTAVAKVHERNGVDVRCGVSVAGLASANGVVTGVELADAEFVPADVVVVGIGVAPATDWLATSGLEVRDGVVCDEALWAGQPGVFAAGDCARWTNQLFGEQMRVEHWTNAAEQGAAAAKNLLAMADGRHPEPYAAVPFFWSDQFDSRIQFLGRPHGDDETLVVAGDPATGACCVLYGYGGRLRGVLGVNMPRPVMPYRALLAARISWADAVSHATTA